MKIANWLLGSTMMKSTGFDTQTGRYKNQEVQPKQHNRGTKPTYQRKPVDRRQKGETTAVCYRCGEKGHYGKWCEKTKDVTCYACGGKRHFAKMSRSKVKTCMFFRKLMEIIVKMRERKFYNYNVRMTPHYHYL